MAASTAGSRRYTPFILSLYDKFTLRFNMNHVWRCPTDKWLAPLFAQNFSKNHLDIGVATGYFPANTLKSSPFEANDHRLTLLDLNTNSLQVARDRILSQNPGTAVTCVTANATTISPSPQLQGFQSISMMNILHCLPGPTTRKSATLRNCVKLLDDDGVLFGCTVLGYPRGMSAKLDRNLLCYMMMKTLNWIGAFDNLNDDTDMVKDGLRQVFKEVEIWTVGSMVLFRARKPVRE